MVSVKHWIPPVNEFKLLKDSFAISSVIFEHLFLKEIVIPHSFFGRLQLFISSCKVLTERLGLLFIWHGLHLEYNERS